MIIDQLPEIESVQLTDEMPVERGQTTYKTPISKIFASPTLTGTPKAPTADVSTDNTQIATTAFANRAAKNAVSTFARPNLLANWYFVGGGSHLGYGKFPINQRGQGTYMLSSDSYGVDRWASFQVGSKHTLNSDGVLIETNGSNYAQIAQRVSTFPQGVITISFLTGSVAPTNSVRIYLLFSDNTNAYYDCGGLGQNDLGYHTFTVSKTVTEIRFYTNASGSKFSLQAAKAEPGDTQTLAHYDGTKWVPNEIPDYETELLRCKTSTADPSDTYANGSVEFGNNIGIVQNTDKATQNISKGQYVIWKGALYTASAAISSGNTLSGSNLTAVGGGGLNDLLEIKIITSPVTKDSGADITIVVNAGVKRCGLAFVDFEYTPGSTLPNWTLLGNLSPAPIGQGFALCQNGYQLVLRTNGEIRVVGPTQPSGEQLRFNLIYPCAL